MDTDYFARFSNETLLAMMGAIPFEHADNPVYEAMAAVVGENMAFAKYTDEALLAVMADEKTPVGFHREASILYRELNRPSDRAEASKRAWGIMNGLSTNFSHAVHLAAQDVRNNRPEFRFTRLTEPVPGA